MTVGYTYFYIVVNTQRGCRTLKFCSRCLRRLFRLIPYKNKKRFSCTALAGWSLKWGHRVLCEVKLEFCLCECSFSTKLAPNQGVFCAVILGKGAHRQF
jgi:hypothetical protein